MTSKAARLAPTPIGARLAQMWAAEATPANRPLTARETLLLRATTRRGLRAATLLGGITASALTPPLAIGMMVMVPEQLVLLLLVFGIEGALCLGITLLALRRWRLPPLPLTFVLAISLTAQMSSLLALVPEIRTPSLMLLALLPPAIALFAPWGVRAQAAWLLASASVLTVVTGAIGGGAVLDDEWHGVWMVLVLSGLVSLTGSLGAAGMRRRAFRSQMEARCAHVATRAREAELDRLNGELALATRKDPLTGLGNRRRLDEELAGAAARATRYDSDCAVALLDLDGFKLYNDSLGHVAGDAALQAVAAALRASVRATDTVCRFGGDEFVVLMPQQALDHAERTADRIRRAVADLQLRYPTPGGPRVLTVSAGIALLGRTAALDEDQVMRRADAELYRAKAGGPSVARRSPILAATMQRRPDGLPLAGRSGDPYGYRRGYRR